jgi:hypothetical protein
MQGQPTSGTVPIRKRCLINIDAMGRRIAGKELAEGLSMTVNCVNRGGCCLAMKDIVL